MKKITALSLIAVLSSASLAVVTPAIAGVSLLLAGPLQSHNAQTGTAVILGQNVSVGSRSLPAAGHTVFVFGTINSDGSLNVSSISGGNVYVPGATDIFLTGVVKTSNPMFDLITVGGVTVDLSFALAASGAAIPPVGTTIQLLGTQPVIGGVILAKAINAGPLVNVTSTDPAVILQILVAACVAEGNGHHCGGGITGSGRPGGPH